MNSSQGRGGAYFKMDLMELHFLPILMMMLCLSSARTSLVLAQHLIQNPVKSLKKPLLISVDALSDLETCYQNMSPFGDASSLTYERFEKVIKRETTCNCNLVATSACAVMKNIPELFLWGA